MAESVLDALLADLPEVTYVPGSEEYRSATSPDNSSYPQSPCAVVQPKSADDAARAIALTAGIGGRVIVQATGHGAGAPMANTDVLLDTSAMQSVGVDLQNRTARVGAGAMWPDVQTAAAPHGLFGLSGTSPTVGVVGYTFSGGVSWFVRKYGLASAALRSVEFIDGAGRLHHARDDAPELIDREALWAFRGGAPVGVATTIDIDLVPVHDLWTGYLLWPADALASVAAAWIKAARVAPSSVSSTLSMLALPPEGPFPAELLGRAVVHLSYASPDGGAPLRAMHDAVRSAAEPVVDTTGPGDLDSLTRIHLDPPAAVPARGTGRWLSAAAPEVLVAMFDAARIGRSGGLNMIELRHTDSGLTGRVGAMTTVPGPFLMHAVGAGLDDATRAQIDDVLRNVEAAGAAADIGRSAPSFREGQPGPADSMSSADRDELRRIRDTLDPRRTLFFQRDPVP